MTYTGQQTYLNLSQCERLCSRWSREVEVLANRSGWQGLPGERMKVTVATALNMMILSTAMSNGVELAAMVQYLPVLRNEALLKLGENISNWSFDGSIDDEHQFWPTLYGTSDAVRPRVARLLGCCLESTTLLLRYHSQSNVECLSNAQLGMARSDQAPKFIINAHDLAERIQAICASPLFIAKVG